MKPLYKSPEAKIEILNLYQEKLNSLDIDYENLDITTSFGQTRVIKTGNPSGSPILLFHGINAGAPVTLEAVKDLRNDYLLYAVDTIGQATMSDENRINILDDSYGKWANEVLETLQLEKVATIGVSYGAYILQKLISYRPEKVRTCIFVVPSGLVNGKLGPSMLKLTFPMMRYFISKKDKHLRKFLSAFIPEDDEFMFRFQKATLNGLNMDYRRPQLLQKENVKDFKSPVFMIVADDDIFFPGIETIEKAIEIFSNFKEAYVLKNSRHMPHKGNYQEIQNKIKEWLRQTI